MIAMLKLWLQSMLIALVTASTVVHAQEAQTPDEKAARDLVSKYLTAVKAKSPDEVILPLPPATEKFVPVISLAPKEIAVTIVGSETSTAVVTPLVPEEVTRKPIGKIRLPSALSMRTSGTSCYATVCSITSRIIADS